MQGDKAIIRLLNAVLTNELTAVNQYFLHARMYENWGFARLGKITYDESIGVLRNALDRARLGDTEKLDGFKRLDRFVRAIEDRAEPRADAR